jgi:hypothetical protein
MSNYPIYSQRDGRWASIHYGLEQASRMSTIGMYGCGITAIAQKLTMRGVVVTPLEVQERFDRLVCFRHYGFYNFIDWEKVGLAYPQLVYNGRYDAPAGQPAEWRIMELLRSRLERDETTIIYVDANRYALGLQQHFVLAIGRGLNGAIEVANPWNGLRQSLRPYDDKDEMAVRGVVLVDWVAGRMKAEG